MISLNKYIFRIILMLISFLLITTSNPLNAENVAFNKVCQSCHTGGFKGFVSGAPNINKKSDWEKYYQRDSEIEMRKIVLDGLNDHELKGGCSKCTDDEINSAIDYILLKTQ